jgi:HD-like signal output (HDOD) protein
LVLFAQAPQASQQVFQLYQRERLLLREAEMRVLGFDHQQIAEALLRLWKFPVHLVQAVAYHHQPMSSQIAREEAAVVHLSDHLVNAMQIGSSGERHVPPLNMLAWETLRLSPDVLSSVVEGIDEQIEAVQDIFLNKAMAA